MVRIIYHGKKRALIAGSYMSDGESRMVGEKMARSLLGTPGLTVEGMDVEQAQEAAVVFVQEPIDQNAPVRVDEKRSAPKPKRGGRKK